MGVKRSILTDRRGMPIGLAISGANTHDQKLLFETLDSTPVRRPPRTGRPQHICLDKGYDSDAIRARLKRRSYRVHLKSRGQEQSEKRKRGQRARRWVVERIASWLNRYRRILVRWEKKVENYEALLHLVFAHILHRNS